jgi:predicted small integral membrane protein
LAACDGKEGAHMSLTWMAWTWPTAAFFVFVFASAHMSLTWMAWTWPTAAFFVFVFASIAAMGVLEWRSPGGAPRRGILGLDTTRGDRLFITLLGSAFIFLGCVKD